MALKSTIKKAFGLATGNADMQQLEKWQERYEKARLAYQGVLTDMDEREGLYAGTKEIRGRNGQKGKDATKNNKPAKSVIYQKRINGNYYVLEAVPDTSKQICYIVSAFKAAANKAPYGNIAKKIQANQLRDENPPRHTPEKRLVAPANNSIPQDNKNNTENLTPSVSPQNRPVTNAAQNPATAQQKATTPVATKPAADSQGIQSHTATEITQQERNALPRTLRTEIATGELLGKRLGITVKWASDITAVDADGNTVSSNGFYDPSTKTLTVRIRPEGSNIAAVVAHEITHALEGSNAYKMLRTAVMDIMHRNGTYDSAYQQVSKDYTTTDKNYIETEMVAQFTETDLLTNEAAIRQIIADNSGLGAKIKNALWQIFNRARGLRYADELTRNAAQLWEKAYKEAGKNGKQADNKNETRYAITVGISLTKKSQLMKR
ncbi:MAG: hypothetical protein PHD32_07395 [Eubacteriales bacterium]|nr:hypothetical protein [Eubacteriales bacterium]